MGIVFAEGSCRYSLARKISTVLIVLLDVYEICALGRHPTSLQTSLYMRNKDSSRRQERVCWIDYLSIEDDPEYWQEGDVVPQLL